MKIKKNIIYISIFLLSFFITSNVNAYNLRFQADGKPHLNGDEVLLYSEYRFITGASSSANAVALWNLYTDGISLPENNPNLGMGIDAFNNWKLNYTLSGRIPKSSVLDEVNTARKWVVRDDSTESNKFFEGYYNLDSPANYVTKEIYFYKKEKNDSQVATKYYTSKPSPKEVAGEIYGEEYDKPSGNYTTNGVLTFPVKWLSYGNDGKKPIKYDDAGKYIKNGNEKSGWIVTGMVEDNKGNYLFGNKNFEVNDRTFIKEANKIITGRSVEDNSNNKDIHLERFSLDNDDTKAMLKQIFNLGAENEDSEGYKEFLNTSELSITYRNSTLKSDYIKNDGDNVNDETGTNMNTAWKYYRVTRTGSSWGLGTNAKEYATNEYDNILILPQVTDRYVIVRHVDTKGNQLENFANEKSLKLSSANESIKINGKNVEYKISSNVESLENIAKNAKKSAEKYYSKKVDNNGLSEKRYTEVAVRIADEKILEESGYEFKQAYVSYTYGKNSYMAKNEPSSFNYIKGQTNQSANSSSPLQVVDFYDEEKPDQGMYTYVYFVYDKAERTIIVNHKDTNGNNIANTQHEKSINGTGDTAANPDVPKTPVKNLWWQTSGRSGQEKYNIKAKENIRVRNAMDILSKGTVEYKYWGYMVVTEETQDAAEKKINSNLQAFVSATSDASKKLMLNGKETEEVYAQKKQTKDKEKADYTYVYFIYEKVVKKHREVYVRHIEYDPETGTKKVLSGVGNKESADNPAIPVTTPIKSGFNEYYKIWV